MARCGSIGWPRRYRGHSSVQKLHWSQADRPILSMARQGARYRATSAWSSASTSTPPVVLVTGSSGPEARRPIMAPPTSVAHRGTVAPPAAATTSPRETPRGTRSVHGRATAPATVRYLWVTGRAWPRFTRVSTLFTSAPTSRGSPPGGMTRPVTS